MEYPETQEIFREENRQIAARIEQLLGEKPHSGVQMKGGRHVIHEDLVATIGVAYDSESAKADIDYFENMPERFKTPSFLFHSWESGDYRERVTTPYGVQNAYVIGSDNKIYYFSNIFFFNKEGEAVKYEEIFTMTEGGQSPEDTIQIVWGNKPPHDLIRVDFVPNEKDSRYAKLEPGDYEKIWGILNQIQRGEFVNPDGKSIVEI